MEIQPLAFANALALTTALLWVILMGLRALSPRAFLFIFNAQFFGADVASLLPAQFSLSSLIGEFVAFVGGAWGFGLVGAVLYNQFIRRGFS